MDKKKITTIVVLLLIIVIILGMTILKDNSVKEVSTTGTFDLQVDENFNKEEVLSKGYPTMLDIGGADCIPCKEMAPTLEKLNKDLKGEAIIKFVDYWKYPDLAKQFEFEVIPTQFFYDENGELYTTHEGGITEDKILEIFEEMGYTFSE